MDKQPEQTSLADLLLAINQLAGIHERIAQSLNDLAKLWAEEMKKRDAEREQAKEWMKNNEEIAARYRESHTKPHGPTIPWQITGVWVLAILMLTLAVVLILIEIYKHVFGTT